MSSVSPIIKFGYKNYKEYVDVKADNRTHTNNKIYVYSVWLCLGPFGLGLVLEILPLVSVSVSKLSGLGLLVSASVLDLLVSTTTLVVGGGEIEH